MANVTLTESSITAEGMTDAQNMGKLAARTDRFSCEYLVGSISYHVFCNAFVIEAVKLGKPLPSDTPMLLAGRIAYLKGQSIKAMPATECYDGCWFSGWIAERDRQQKLKA